MLSDRKFREIQELNDNQFWPLIKQQLDVRQMCYIVYALQQWQSMGCPGAFHTFFDEHKTLPQYGSLLSSTNYRMLSNAPQFGFVYPYQYVNQAVITPAFKLIDNVCGSDFSRIDLYQHLVDAQLEKAYTDTNLFKVHTVMFLLKVLLSIGDVTGRYSVSLTELKLFVVTAKKWSDYLMTVDSILRYRENDVYKRECDSQLPKFANSRHNQLFNNISYIDATDSNVSLVESAIKSVRLKVANFENLGAAEINRRMHEDYLAGSDSDTRNNHHQSLQKIVYGAPGSGKSHAVRKEVMNEHHMRVTFHPDTDYNSFVGAYKPVQNGDTIKYVFAPQQFAKAYVEAWKTYLRQPGKRFYFVIEEINRGNCALIFGDIFQLLDRKEDGFSEYPINIDPDFAGYIKSSLMEAGCLTDYKRYFDGNNESCELIMFPPNFHILATMNTSDQSLFPMDSAFKRRWEWQFIPIDHDDASKTTIVIDDKHKYNWGEFIVAVNERIFMATGSPDKQLGNRFVQIGSDRVIDSQQFQGKILFYLWEEVFKDNKKHSIFEKDKDFFRVYDNTAEICHIIEDVLHVSNIAIPPVENFNPQFYEE